MNASLVFTPVMCSDDGRALAGHWNVYTRRGDVGFWNEPKRVATKEAAVQMCADNGWKIVSERWA